MTTSLMMLRGHTDMAAQNKTGQKRTRTGINSSSNSRGVPFVVVNVGDLTLDQLQQVISYLLATHQDAIEQVTAHVLGLSSVKLIDSDDVNVKTAPEESRKPAVKKKPLVRKRPLPDDSETSSSDNQDNNTKRSEGESSPHRKKNGRAGPKRGWESMFEALKEFKSEHGHCRVPFQYDPFPSLGRWVGCQRCAYKRRNEGKHTWLTDERVERLNKLGFVWKAIKVDFRGWHDWYEDLKVFYKEHGHCRVPVRYQPDDSNASPLRRWVCRQRLEYKKFIRGEKARITPERIEALEKLEIDWEMNIPRFTWNDRLEQVKQFKETYGHTDVNGWLSQQQQQQRQRQQQQQKNGKGDGEDGDDDDDDDYDYDDEIPPEYLELAAWTANQKTQYRRRKEGESSTLTDEKVASLSLLGFDFETTCYDDKWESCLDELRKYKEKHGHTRVKPSHGEYGGLANWVKRQRDLYRRRKDGHEDGKSLTNHRISALEALGFEWSQRKRQQ